MIYVSLPATYFYVFFYLVPKWGLEDHKLNKNFGFLWSRFEPRAYWWEGVDMSECRSRLGHTYARSSPCVAPRRAPRTGRSL